MSHVCVQIFPDVVISKGKYHQLRSNTEQVFIRRGFTIDAIFKSYAFYQAYYRSSSPKLILSTAQVYKVVQKTIMGC